MESPPKMSHDSFTFRFPARLWRIINSCSSGAISWGPNGKTVRILRKKFEEEYLTGDIKPFKTTKYESFVRQLNHYGFKKVKKRSALKKITLPTIHGDTKEEATMLSEYHNPNFTRGQPERVTFLERRSQLQDESRSKKRGKRSAPHRDAAENHASVDRSTAKKLKKETSVQVSHTSLPAEANCDGTNAAEDDETDTESTTIRHSVEAEDVVPQQRVSVPGDFSGTTRNLTQPYMPGAPNMTPVSPAFSRQRGSGETVMLLEGSAMPGPRHVHRPYSSPMETRFPLSPFPPHPSSSWPPPYRPRHPPPLYDDYGPPGSRMFYNSLCPGRGENVYGTGYGSRHVLRGRPEGRARHGVYSDDRYPPWQPVYSMNRRSVMPMMDDYDEDFDPDHLAGDQMRFQCDHSVSRYPYTMSSPDDLYLPSPEPMLPVNPHPFDGIVPRPSVHARMPIMASNAHPLMPTDSPFQMRPDVHWGRNQGVHNHVLHSQATGSNGSSCYRQSNAARGFPAAAWSVTGTKARVMAPLASVSQISRRHGCGAFISSSTMDGASSTAVTSVQHNIRVEKTSTKNHEDQSQDFVQSTSIMAEDPTDLPLDVAEETVITCNVSTPATNFCSPLMPYSSVEETILIDTLINTTAFFPTEEASRMLNHRSQADATILSGPFSDTPLPLSSQCSGGFSRLEPSVPAISTANIERYRQQDILPVPTKESASQEAALRLGAPAPSQLEGIGKALESPVTTCQLFVQKQSGTATMDPNCALPEVSPADNQKAEDDVVCPRNPILEAGNEPTRRQEREELAQLSSTSVQELLSAALRTPGMKIMVDDNYHRENMVLVIPKEKRRELNGCV